MTTKIKVKPIAIGALAGLAVGYGASKMMGKKRTMFLIAGAVVGGVVGHFVGKKGEKKSNAAGTMTSSTSTYTPKATGFCKRPEHGGGKTPSNYYTYGDQTFRSNLCTL